ncbi:UDP-N-acetylglucosamine 2-epimerase [Rhodopirellula sp. JC639]|uniref:UDP-N-acetylglucosamine 2-epimerase n=1 Tax=Stieleria mannarensis TaxID=2755585 RepID=UPI00160414C0|nr:UDP-N-acetylglucosamine 2-epimerase [Rhodopirellula sp. JC639]
MIHFFIGTKAQLIKMAPLMRELSRRRVPFRYVDSGQHAEITRKLRYALGLPEPCISLRDSEADITSMAGAARWYLKHLASTWFARRRLREQIFPGGGVCLIHGDTLSTLLGLQLSRAAGLSTVHVEAGLRSFKWFNPFPEELIRIWCMHRADLLFAPSQEAAQNLTTMNVRGKVVPVCGNTVVDSLRMVLNEEEPRDDLPKMPYVLATCHRLETITHRKRFADAIRAINEVSSKIDVEFVIHRPTKNYLRRFGLADQLNANVTCRDMLDYPQFIGLLRHACGVITDGGSIQEECGYLQMPCLVLRETTERSDGLGTTALLWDRSSNVVEQFTAQLRKGHRPATVSSDQPSPTAEIADKLLAYASSQIQRAGN